MDHLNLKLDVKQDKSKEFCMKLSEVKSVIKEYIEGTPGNYKRLRKHLDNVGLLSYNCTIHGMRIESKCSLHTSVHHQKIGKCMISIWNAGDSSFYLSKDEEDLYLQEKDHDDEDN